MLIIKNKYKIVGLMVLLICLLTVFCGCNQRYRLTVEGEVDLAEKLKRRYQEGEKVTVKIHMMHDATVEILLDGVLINDSTSVEYGENYIWEYYFVMPKHNAILKIQTVDGFLTVE